MNVYIVIAYQYGLPSIWAVYDSEIKAKEKVKFLRGLESKKDDGWSFSYVEWEVE